MGSRARPSPGICVSGPRRRRPPPASLPGRFHRRLMLCDPKLLGCISPAMTTFNRRKKRVMRRASPGRAPPPLQAGLPPPAFRLFMTWRTAGGCAKLSPSHVSHVPFSPRFATPSFGPAALLAPLVCHGWALRLDHRGPSRQCASALLTSFLPQRAATSSFLWGTIVATSSWWCSSPARLRVSLM